MSYEVLANTPPPLLVVEPLKETFCGFVCPPYGNNEAGEGK